MDCKHENVTVKESTGFKKPENKGRRYESCLDCNEWLGWKDEKKAPANVSDVKTEARGNGISFRIERQHSQEMAIRMMELELKVKPDAFKEAVKLADEVKKRTDWFMADLEKKEEDAINF